MLLEFGEVVKGVDAVQFASMDQAHIQIAYSGAVWGLKEVSVLTVQNRFLECSFADVVVQGGSGLPKEQR